MKLPGAVNIRESGIPVLRYQRDTMDMSKSNWQAVERFCTPMRWNPSDSGLPNEIGFWSVSDGSHDRSEMRWFFYDSNAATATCWCNSRTGR